VIARTATRTKLALSTAAVCLVAIAAPAWAAPAGSSASPTSPTQSADDSTQAKSRAQALLKEGTAAYGRGDYATALDKFTAAYEIFPSPKLWFNIGQANRDLGRPVEAVAAFDRFLRDAGDAPPETVAEARRSAAELKTKLGQIKITCAIDGADVTVDGKPIGSTPLGEMVWTTPGRHQVAVQRAGFSPAIEDVVVATGQAAAVDFKLRPVDLRLANAGSGGLAIGGGPGGSERKPIYRRGWFWVAAGVVVAAGAGAAVILSSSSRGSSGFQPTLGAQRIFE
jgi:tetratricopeptide (TPR) repeat protein